MIRAVLFDVDFTLARPGPELGPEGYVRAGERHGLRLEPGRYEAARDAALVDLRRHPELEQRVGVGHHLVPRRHDPRVYEAACTEALRFWSLGVWRSLVARSVRVGEAPSSNLGTPTDRGGTPGSPAPDC